MASTVEVVVTLKRLDEQGQARLQALMDKNTEEQLTQEERRELESLVAQYEENMLANAEALVRASYPELLDEAGQIDRERLARAIRQRSML